MKVLYFADNTVENGLRWAAAPDDVSVTDLDGCRRVILLPGMSILLPPGTPHKVFNLSGRAGSLAISWDFRFRPVSEPYLAGVRRRLGRQGGDREAALALVREILEPEEERGDYTVGHAQRDIADELQFLRSS